MCLFLDKYASQFGSGSQYAYYHDEDESTFHLVDTTRVQKPPYQRGRFKGNQRNMRGRGMRGGMQSGGMQALGKGLKNRDRDKRNQVKKWGQGRVSLPFKFVQQLLFKKRYYSRRLKFGMRLLLYVLIG